VNSHKASGIISKCRSNDVFGGDLLGNTILVKLKLWELDSILKHFGLPLTYAYATLRQSVAGNSPFGELFVAM